jgi:hypothetical protein
VFEACFSPLTQKTDKSRALRQQQWRSADGNGNGFCSLSEIDAWIKSVITHTIKATAKDKAERKQLAEEAERLWSLFRPCYIRAFTDAADIMEEKRMNGRESSTTDDFVQKQEFKALCAYLCIYARMHDAFHILDGSASKGRWGGELAPERDRRISLQEWQKGIMKVRGHGFVGLAGLKNAAEAKKLFAQIDTNGGGSILLDEFCAYLKQEEQRARTEVGRLLSAGDST